MEERWVVEYKDPDPKKKPVWENIRGWFMTEARANFYIEEYQLKGARARRILIQED